MSQSDAWARALDPLDPEDAATLSSDDRATARQAGLILADPETWSGPPPALRGRLMAAVRAEAAATGPVPIIESAEQVPDGDVVVALRPSRRTRWLIAAGGFVAGAAAAAVVAAVVVTAPTEAGQTFDLAATSRNPQAVVTAQVDPQSAGVAITLTIVGLPAAPEGTYYAAWLEGEAGTVPVGTFHWREGGVPIELWSGVATDRYPRLYVTLQDESLPADPSGVVVLDGIVS